MKWKCIEDINNKDKIYIISQTERPIKIVFEKSPLPIEVRNDQTIVKIPITYLSDIKFGMICEKDFTPEQWKEIEKELEENNNDMA